VFEVSKSWVIDRVLLSRYFRYGFPSGLEAFMNVVTFNVFLLMFQTYGLNEGAAMAIVFNWDLLSFISMVGLHIAVMSLSGRYVGAGEVDNLNKLIVSAFGIALGVTLTVAVIFWSQAEFLVDIFDTGEPGFAEIRALAIAMMLGLACYVMADGLNLAASGVLRGAGDTRWLMFVSVGIHWLMLGIQIAVIKVYKLDPMVSWWVFVTMLVCLAVAYIARLKFGPWRDPERLARLV
jgi:MATE family multidrug resistance protein